MRLTILTTLAILATSVVAVAQTAAPAPFGPYAYEWASAQSPKKYALQGRGAYDGLAALPGGTWWRNEAMAKSLNLTADQQRKMDEVFLQYRIRLIDLNAALEKAEAMLEPFVEAVRPEDEAQMLAHIDRIAESRAELEKANARMLLGIRQVLTQDQWNQLRTDPKKYSVWRAKP